MGGGIANAAPSMPAGGGLPPPLPPAVLAAAAAEARAFLRLADTDADAAIERLAATALGIAEAFLGLALVARQFEDVVAGDGRWVRLAASPVSAILGAVSLPPDAAPAVLPVDAWAVDIDARGTGRVRVNGGRTAVTYVAGLAGDWSELPAPIAQGAIALVAQLYADRDVALPPGVAALWRPFRRLRLVAGDRP